MKNLNVKQIGRSLQTGLSRSQRYATFIFIITILLIYSFLVFRIGTLSQAEPSEDAIAEKTNTVKRLKIDEDSIKKIIQLEDQNVAVKSLFNEARDNPFQ
ncbi:MAG: hypothetical protein ACR2FM_02740 [Candidatus Saccharimonadales bacterium]